MKRFISSGEFKMGANGPAEYLENIIIPLNVSTRKHTIEENTTVEGETPVGIYITDPGVLVETGKTQAAEAVFNTAYLTIREGQIVILERLYLSTIKKYNDQGKPFPLNLPGPINLSRSTLEVVNSGGIQANTVIQMQLLFLVQK